MWWILIIVVLVVAIGAWQAVKEGETAERQHPASDLTEEEIEYDYLQREEERQEEEDEWILEQHEKDS